MVSYIFVDVIISDCPPQNLILKSLIVLYYFSLVHTHSDSQAISVSDRHHAQTILYKVHKCNYSVWSGISAAGRGFDTR